MDLLALKTLGPAAFRGKRMEPEKPKKAAVKMSSDSSSDDEVVGYETVQVPATEKQVLKLLKAFLKKVKDNTDEAHFSAVYDDGDGPTETEGERTFTLRSKDSYVHTLQGKKGATFALKPSHRIKAYILNEEHLIVQHEEMDGKGDPSVKEVAKAMLAILRSPEVVMTSNEFTIPTKKTVRT